MLQDSTVKVCVSVLGKKVHVHVGGSVCTCVYVNVVKKTCKVHQLDFDFTPSL